MDHNISNESSTKNVKTKEIKFTPSKESPQKKNLLYLTDKKSPDKRISNKFNKSLTSKSNRSINHHQTDTSFKMLLENPIKIVHPTKDIINKTIPLTKQKENTYNEYFDCFPQKFQEKVYTFKRRREAIQNNRYYTDFILKEINLVDKLKYITRNYYKILDEQLDTTLKELPTFNDLFSPFFSSGITSDKYIKQILENKPSTYNSVISPLLVFENYLKSYNITASLLSNNIKFIRKIRNDGDSFYVAFMFSLLEIYILTGNLRELQKLILDIYKVLQNKLEEYKDKKIDIDRFFKIYYDILNLVDRGLTIQAHTLLCAGFNSLDDSFINILILYVRNILFLIVEDFQNEILKNYPQIKKNIINGGGDDLDDVNLLLITNFKNEACKYALQLLPMIFNINLDVLIYDGEIENGIPNINEYTERFSSLPISIMTEDNQNLDNNQTMKSHTISTSMITIQVVYMMNGYLLGYTNFTKSLIEIRKYEELFIYDQYYCSISEENQIKVCSKCKKNEKNIIIPYYGLSLCFECTKIFTKYILMRRVTYMNKENYNSIEFYNRPFILFDDVYLDAFSYTMLFQESINCSIRKLIKKLCFACDSIFMNDTLIKLSDCKCQFCNECLNKYISNYTQGNYIINKLEKNYYTKIKCPCNDIFNLDLALTFIKKDLHEAKEESIQRLNKYASTLCMRCIKLMRVDHSLKQAKETKSYKFVPILEKKSNPTDNEISFNQHLLCSDCIEYLKEWDKLESQENKSQERKIVCKICDATHIISELSWNEIMKEERCHCIIY